MRRRMGSPVFAQAIEVWREIRDEFEDYRLSAYARAEHDCNGVMLNSRGKRQKVDAYSLFIGPRARAEAFASAELIEHWQKYPRPVFAPFERARLDERHAS
jgi:hypothetical protein